jgi:hypothetical protein
MSTHFGEKIHNSKNLIPTYDIIDLMIYFIQKMKIYSLFTRKVPDPGSRGSHQF